MFRFQQTGLVYFVHFCSNLQGLRQAVWSGEQCFEHGIDRKLHSPGMLVCPERFLVGFSQSAAPLWDLSCNCCARLRSRDNAE